MQKIQKVTIVDLESTLPNLTSQFFMPRHGVLSIGTALSKSKLDVEIQVECLNGIDKKTLYSSDLVGAAVTSCNLNRVESLFQEIQKERPDIVLVAGGPHATLSPARSLEFAHFVVRDEGEETICELVEALQLGKGFNQVQGLSYLRDGIVSHTPRRKFLGDLPWMEDLSLLTNFKPLSFFQQLRKGRRSCALVSSSRGCPFKCSFCYENMIGGTGFRKQSVDVLISDIRQKKEFFKTNRFWLTDSNFGTNPTHTNEVLEAIVDANLGCQFTALCRVEIGNRPDTLDLMKKAGVVTVSIGMEALDDARLKSIEKRQTLEQIRSAISSIHQRNIAVFGLFMVGFDGDTKETPWEIGRFCKREGVEGMSIYCLTEYPSLPGRTLPRHRICEPNLDFYSGHFVTTFPKDVRPSVLEKNVYGSLVDFYSIRRNVRALATLDWHKLRFSVPLFLQSRRMAKISKRHQEFLQKVETPYYDSNDLLNIEYLKQNPPVKITKPLDEFASWDDAKESDTPEFEHQKLISLN